MIDQPTSRCQTCDGFGILPDDSEIDATCSTCWGSGSVDAPTMDYKPAPESKMVVGKESPSEGKIAPGTRVTSLGGGGIVRFYDCDKNKYAIRWDDAPQSGKEAYWSREELTVFRPGGYIKEAIKNVAHDNSVDDKYANPFPPGLLSNKVTSDSSDEEQDRDLHGPINLTGGLVIQDVYLQEAIENVVRAHGRAEELLRDLGDARHFFESAILSRARAKTEGGKDA